MMQKLELANKYMQETGVCLLWFGAADKEIKGLTSGMNGPLLETLLKASKYEDVECVALIREGSHTQLVTYLRYILLYASGASMIGEIPCSGVGKPIEVVTSTSTDELWTARRQNNSALIGTLKEDKHAEWLLSHTKAEAAAGRMSKPEPLSEEMQENWKLQPRFAVEQTKPDGSMKLRAIDNFSWSAEAGSVNDFTIVTEKLCHDTLDMLARVLSAFQDKVKAVPGLLKADIDAAFRRVPVRSSHRWACGIVFQVGLLVNLLCSCVCSNKSRHVSGVLRTTFRMPIWICGISARVGAVRCRDRARSTKLLAHGATPVR